MKAAAQERRPTERLGFNPNTTESTEHRPSPKSFHHTNPQKEESEKVGLKLNNEKTKIMASDPITSWQQMGKQWLTLFFWAPKSLQMLIAAMKLKDAYSLEGKL